MTNENTLRPAHTPPAARRASPWLLRAGRAAPFLLLACTVCSVFAQTVDDPYITFRYAANLIAGHGAVFNVGDRVEGYTSPLHMLLAASLLVLAPSVDILFKAKCASLFFAFVMLVQTGTLARRTGLNAWGAVLAQTLVALNINFAIMAVNALETTLYGSLLLAGVLVFQRECRRGRGVLSALVLFVATLARPEAPLVVAALLLVRLGWMRRRRLPLRFALTWLLAFLAPCAAFELVRWGYYGQLLPNTYFAKSQPLHTSLLQGLLYFFLRAISPGPMVSQLLPDFFKSVGELNRHTVFDPHSLPQRNLRSQGFYIVMPLVFWGVAALGVPRMARRPLGVIGLAVIAAVFLFILKSGGDWMYGWRFAAPILPLLAVSQCYGVRAFSRWLAGRARRPSRPAPALTARNAALVSGAALAALWLVSSVKTTHFPWSRAGYSTRGSRLLQVSEGYGPLWARGADFIRRSFPRGATLAYSEMGYAGYLNMDKTMIDTRGLTDRQIAGLPNRFKCVSGVADPSWYRPGDPLYRILQARRPDAIMSFAADPPDLRLHGYRQTGVLPMPTNDKQGLSYVYVYRRLYP